LVADGVGLGVALAVGVGTAVGVGVVGDGKVAVGDGEVVVGEDSATDGAGDALPAGVGSGDSTAQPASRADAPTSTARRVTTFSIARS